MIRRPAAAIALALGICAACRAEEEQDPYDRAVADAIPRIESSVGLKFKQQPKLERRSRDELRQFLQQQLDEPEARRELAGQERSAKLLGLIPDSLDVRKLLLDVLTEQVIGFYDPATKALYVVEGARPDETVMRQTITHELVHALQDQYIDLDSILHATGDNDRSTAAKAAIEGQATYHMVAILVGGRSNIATRLPGGWGMVRDMIRDQQGAMPQLASAPLYVQETLVFPYLTGAEFMRRLDETRPTTQPFDPMPVSTEQVMHAEAFFTGRDEPTGITLPAPSGARETYQNNFGEFETRLFLYQHTEDQAGAIRGAAGWDGDRYLVLDTPGGPGIAWLTVWDSAVDAGEFLGMLERTVRQRHGDVRSTGATGGARTYTAAARTIYIDPTEVQGRPVVLYVDVPAAAPARVVDLGRVRLSR